MAPIWLRLSFRRAISSPTSKSSCWILITLSSGDRREKGNLARSADRGVVARMGLVDCRPDDFGAGKSVVELRAARLKPGHQLGDRGYLARQLHLFSGHAGLLLDPGEIEEAGAHGSSSVLTWRIAARR